MDAIKEKFVNMYIDSLSDEEQEKEFGIAKNDFVAQELKYIKQLNGFLLYSVQHLLLLQSD